MVMKMNKGISIAIWIILAIAVIGVIVLIAQPKGNPNVTPEDNPNATAPTDLGTETTPTTCTDPSCFSTHFLECTPSELEMPFGDDSTYIITMIGAENGNCHYTAKIIDKQGNVFNGVSTDCLVPLDKMTSERMEHLFGVDSTPGKEAVKAEQDKLDADYCVTQ